MVKDINDSIRMKKLWNEGKVKGMTGKHHSEETKRKMSIIVKNQWKIGIRNRLFSERHKSNISNSLMGKHHTKEAREKMSKARKGIKLSKEHIEKIINANTGRKHTQEELIKMSQGNIGRKHSIETKLKMSEKKREHRIAILNEAKNLERQGYRTLVCDFSPRPDIIAFKDGKIYAYEVQFRRVYPERCPSLVCKYDDCNFFDKVIWIKKIHRA